MKKRNRLLDRLVPVADMDAALQPKLPIVEIAGCNRILIENHLSVTAYSPQKVCIKVNYGQICVTGESLDLVRMGKEQLVITGSISCVQLCRKGR